MSNNPVSERLEPSVRIAAPVVVLFLVGAGRVLLGMALGQPAHPITFIAMTAGTVGATAVVVFGETIYEPGTSPTERIIAGDRRVRVAEDFRAAARWTVLFAGTIAGGVYPTVFRGLLGLPGRYITNLFPAFATAALWGVAIFLLILVTYLAVGAISLDDGARSELVPFAQLHALYTVTFGVIVGFSRLLWYPLLGV